MIVKSCSEVEEISKRNWEYLLLALFHHKFQCFTNFASQESEFGTAQLAFHEQAKQGNAKASAALK